MASQITHIRKPDYPDHHEAIEAVGGYRNGTWFAITREQCASDILSGAENYFVKVLLYDVGVEAYEMHNTRFIKTYPDSTTRDNLLSLPRF